MLPPPIVVDLNDIKQKLSVHFRPFQRSFQFWVRAIDIYTGYKVSLSLSLNQLNYACFQFASFTSIAGVSIASQFRERCPEARSNVGKAARDCC
jgi:hypothetical protein